MTWRERLRAKVAASGMSRTELSRRAGLGTTAVRDILERGTVPSVETLAALAEVLQCPLYDILDGGLVLPRRVTVSGVVTASGDWVACPPSVTKIDDLGGDLVAVLIDAAARLPGYRPGDVVISARTAALDNHIGRDVICESETGERRLGVLQRGREPGRYDVRALDPHQADLIGVAWAAPVKVVIR